MTDNKLIFWVCDYSKKTGEGNLARKFIKECHKNKNIKINTINKKKIYAYKYIIPFLGIIDCWKNYLRGYQVGYINYLPLWNFLIFIFLPPRSI